MARNLKDMDFKELVNSLTWEAISGIIRGVAMKSIVYHIAEQALLWKQEQDNKEQKS